MTVKEMVRILYLSGAVAGSNAILDAETVTHMYKKLLPARGGVGPESFNLIADCADTAGEELGSPEDYADRQDLGGDIVEAAEEVGKWLLNFFTKVIVLAVAVAITGPLAVAGWVGLHIVGLNDPLTNFGQAPFDFRLPETENHRLMIESSRYLTNAAIIRHLRRRGQLVEAASGVHLWADRFDGDVGDVFDLQERITESVVAANEPSTSTPRIAKPLTRRDATKGLHPEQLGYPGGGPARR